MFLRKLIASAVVGASLLLASCSTPKNISLFQDVQTGSIIDPATQLDIRVRPDDRLFIYVTTQNEELTQLFNLGSGSNSNTSTSSNTMLYAVDPQGNINFPVLGTLHIAGMTRYEVADFIAEQLRSRQLVKDPVVTVDWRNTAFYALGELGHAGRIEFDQDKLTIVDAIAMAGDIKLSGQREDILVMRKEANGDRRGYRINLLDLDKLAQSPVYYIQQDDVIYVQPNDMTKRNTRPLGNSPFTPAFWISLGSTALTVVTLILTLTK